MAVVTRWADSSTAERGKGFIIHADAALIIFEVFPDFIMSATGEDLVVDAWIVRTGVTEITEVEAQGVITTYTNFVYEFYEVWTSLFNNSEVGSILNESLTDLTVRDIMRRLSAEYIDVREAWFISDVNILRAKGIIQNDSRRDAILAGR